GNTLVIDIDEAKDMGGSGTARIEAALLGAETKAWHAKRQNVCLLARRELAAQPDKACIAVELAVGLSIIEVRQDRLELLDRLINVDDAARLGEEGGGLDISRQNLPVTIEDVRTRGGGTALRQVDDRLFNHAEMHKTGTNGAIDGEDHTHGHEDAAARTRAAALGRALNGDPARNLLARTELER